MLDAGYWMLDAGYTDSIILIQNNKHHHINLCATSLTPFSAVKKFVHSCLTFFRWSQDQQLQKRSEGTNLN
jgi:hypothetical protein